MDKTNYELMEQFMRLQWLLSRYFHRNLRAHGLRGVPYSGQGRVLKLLKMQPEIAQKELAEILGMRSQSMGELLSKLEKKGYITRTPSPGDKRVIIVHLTEEGANAQEQETEQPGPVDLFNSLSGEEQSTLKSYLGRIISDLEERYGDDRGGWRRRGRVFQEDPQNQNDNPQDFNFGRTHLHERYFRN